MSGRIDRTMYAIRSYSWLVDPRAVRPQELPIDRPIFLLGVQGGGLTLLSRMLRRHPQVISGAGDAGYWTAADEIQNIYGPILPHELTGLRYKASPHPVLKGPRSWTYAARDLYPHYRKLPEDATPELKARLERAIRLSARRHARNPARFRFVDKSQAFTVRVGLIHALLEQSAPRFVLVPRDPYVAVHRAAIGKAADMRRLRGKLPYEERVDICAEHYGNSMRAVFEDVDQLGIDFHTAPFEKLLSEPERVLRGVCEFVDLDFRPDMLPTPDQRLPIGSRYRDRWYPLRADANEPYEAGIDRTTSEAVDRHVGDLVDRLGYPRRS